MDTTNEINPQQSEPVLPQQPSQDSPLPEDQTDNGQTVIPPVEKPAGILSFFKPREGYFITPILVLLNIVIFILMAINGVSVFEPDGESLLKWGANYRPFTLEGEWWRLLTNCFLHIGIFHLLLNMYALVYIGMLLEPYLGKIRFLIAYILTGIAASVASLWWHDLTISAGASGAIFGMYGVFLAMLTTNLIEKSARKSLLTSIGIFVVYNLIYGLKGGIDNAAHIGGLVSGILVGYLLYPGLRNAASGNLKYKTLILPAIIVLTLSVLIYKTLPDDIVEYNRKMETFYKMEEKAIAIFTMPENTPKETLLSEINNNGIKNWNQNLTLLKEVNELKLPVSLHQRNQQLILYCELRIKSYNLIYKTIEEDTQAYQDSLAHYNTEIEKIINGLKKQ